MSIEAEQERLLRGPRRDLEQARHDPATWTGLAYLPGQNAVGRPVDRNRAARFRVLWALQYDRRPQDLALLRFLLQEQIAYYRQAVRAGLAPDLPLAGFLVAEHRQAEDVWLHWQANSINFDTALGYHLFHLLTPGVAAVVATVRASSHPDRDRILRVIDPARHTDAAVEEWLTQQRDRFPASPERESLKTWAYHAARIGEGEASRLFMLGWADGQPRTWSTLNTLQFHLAGLGYLQEAVGVQKEAVAVSATEPWNAETSSWLTLAELERQAGNFAGAQHALGETEKTMPADKSGSDQGLWRHYVKECFLLVPTAPDEAAARRLLAAADQHLQGLPRLWRDGVLRAALAAADHLHDTGMMERYQTLMQAADRERESENRQPRS
jgi:hypothetical protein